MKKTAIDYLIDEFKQRLIGNDLPDWVVNIIDQAKEMEENQIVNAYENGQENPYEYSNDNEVNWYNGNWYYNETFKSE